MKYLSCLALSFCIVSPCFAGEDNFPSKPLKIIVPGGPGSSSDALARLLAERMAVSLGQPVVVENKAGADGVIGMMAVKNLPADGYTIVQGGMSAAAINVATMPNMPYDPVGDFKGLHAYLWGMSAMLTAPSSRIQTIDQMRKKGGNAVTVATSTTAQAMAVAMIAKAANIELQAVPYKGAGAALTDLMGGHVDLAYVDIAGAMGQLKQGVARAIFVTGAKRSTQLPDVPTAHESGIRGVAIAGWNALYVRSETPEPIRAKLVDAHRQALASDAAKRFMFERDMYIEPVSAKQMQEFQRSEIDRYSVVAQTVGTTR